MRAYWIILSYRSEKSVKLAWDNHRKTQQITPEICQYAFGASRKFDKKVGKYAKIMKKNTKSM